MELSRTRQDLEGKTKELQEQLLLEKVKQQEELRIRREVSLSRLLISRSLSHTHSLSSSLCLSLCLSLPLFLFVTHLSVSLSSLLCPSLSLCLCLCVSPCLSLCASVSSFGIPSLSLSLFLS